MKPLIKLAIDSKHTTGSWIASAAKGDNSNFVIEKRDADGFGEMRYIAITTDHFGEKEESENAKLLAAAPDMLKALLVIQGVLQANKSSGLNQVCLNTIKNTLKKAEIKL
jgi:hypothetical protein